ncbi:flagellar hook assembly protein FlgD [Tepidanaerobacter syntrophicus]|uniref:Flagellar basal-body rod modification protein FlgD n=1 Tax=Tepidanaerobacter syntrophicus TaxID=224999 RepID=A0A0U9HHP3_9FIRM|nr:flagellar hook capping FlgD N-terminal domain-containing protein [Tepidanaerobacter syntrophicus]GAQ26253.1 flagellar basal-body rod modification protein FlgD [Tepidanaerobacter syntrophicus]GLI50125.1 flagellar hook assembly protein FlgD [Tepidanaerobacter syntrophicus]HHV83533.1 flagellar hook capping protein [Tepidanaerobacter syntrophicus]
MSTSINTDYYNGAVNKQQESKASQLDKDDFLKLLVTQLRYQNPLEPMDNNEYIAQLAQFSSLEQMQNLNLQVANLSALSTIGKSASAIVEQSEIEGVITGIAFNEGTVNLIIDTGDYEVKVPIANVAEIR